MSRSLCGGRSICKRKAQSWRKRMSRMRRLFEQMPEIIRRGRDPCHEAARARRHRAQHSCRTPRTLLRRAGPGGASGKRGAVGAVHRGALPLEPDDGCSPNRWRRPYGALRKWASGFCRRERRRKRAAQPRDWSRWLSGNAPRQLRPPCRRHGAICTLSVRCAAAPTFFLPTTALHRRRTSRRAAVCPCCVTMWKRQAAEWRYRVYPRFSTYAQSAGKGGNSA